jgi:phospholipid/cholesterol/gamma-HCH transport system ATP-binding protein
MSQTPKIEMCDVHKAFGPKHVLNGVDLHVDAGESLVIIGGSGSGKSVMLKCMLGLILPDRGTVIVDGEDVTNFKGKERERVLKKFGMLFQNAALFDSLKVWENVAFGLIEGEGMDRESARGIAFEKLARVGLTEDVGNLDPAELSGGMKKRVGLARAIATEPEIIFFDEPTTGLDPIMGDVINHLIIECVKDLGSTAITITHDMASARTIADRVAMIFKGEIIWNGPVESITSSGNEYVDQFISGRAEGPIEMDVLKP